MDMFCLEGKVFSTLVHRHLQALTDDLKVKVQGIRLCCGQKALFIELDVPVDSRVPLLNDMTEERKVALFMLFLTHLLFLDEKRRPFVAITTSKEGKPECYELWDEEHVDRSIENRIDDYDGSEIDVTLHDDPAEVAGIILNAWILRKVIGCFATWPL